MAGPDGAAGELGTRFDGGRPVLGRGSELGLLRSAVDATRAGLGGLWLVIGEPGIGKTSILGEVVGYARDQGVPRIVARCRDSSGTPDFWPWVQVLRRISSVPGYPEAVRRVGLAATALADLAPEAVPAGLGDQPRLPPEQHQFRLFEAVVQVLAEAAEPGALLVALDDLHWADLSSLRLLGHAAAELGGSRVLVLGTVREVVPDPARAGLLSEVYGRADVHRVDVRGLDSDHVAQLVETLTGRPASTGFVRDIAERTGGNPFFIGELVRMLAGQGEQGGGDDRARLAGVPGGVRAVITGRLRQVSPDCALVLGRACVQGRTVEFSLLEPACELPVDRVLAALDEAVDARLLSRVPGHAGRYSFAHALINETLYADLPTVVRAAAHARAAEALAAMPDHVRAPRLAELAHHCAEALPAGGDPSVAAMASVAAARRGTRSLAHEEAARWLTRALSIVDAAPTPTLDPTDLLLELGAARAAAGEFEESRQAFLRAAQGAQEAGDADRLARAALGYGQGPGGFGFAAGADTVLLGLLDSGLAATERRDTPQRVRLLARLATELHFTGMSRRRRELAGEAVAMAVRLRDDESLLVALYARTWALLDPDGAEERLSASADVVRLATGVGDPVMSFRGRHLRVATLLELGRQAEADLEVMALGELAERMRQPLYDWQAAVLHAMQALRQGRYEEGAELAEEALRRGTRACPDMAAVSGGAQLVQGRWGAGRLAELLPVTSRFADAYPHAPAWRAAHAYVLACADETEAAVEQVELVLRDGVAALPWDGNWLTATALLGLTVAATGASTWAGPLYDALTPYGARMVVIAAGAVVLTSVAHVLGVLAHTLGKHDRALDHLAVARVRHLDAKAPGLAAWSLLELGRVLADRAGPGDQQAAVTTLRQSRREARHLGMAFVADAAGRQGAGGIDGTAEPLRLPDQRPRPPSAGRHADLALLFTDIVGSTESVERLGEARAHALLRQHNDRVRAVTRTHGGQVARWLGDGFLLAFPAVEQAVACAVDLQRQWWQDDAGRPAVERLPVRMGAHAGPVRQEEDGLYGLTVVRAARIAGIARAREVLVSSEVRRRVPHLFRFEPGRRVLLKGLPDAETVFPVAWRPAAGSLLVASEATSER